MKKVLTIIAVLSMLLMTSGCQQTAKIDKSLEVKEMRAISELATVECYFHNVAKSNEPTNKAWFEFWKKENIKFWVEYEGIVKIGIDATQLKMEVDGETVRITLPEAIVLDAKVNPDSLNENSFYYDSKSYKPTAAQQTEAFKQAQEEMKATAQANSALLANARENAKELLENYVKTISEATGIQYTIEWIYPEDNQ